MIAFAILVAFWLLGPVIGFAFAAIGLALRLAVVAAVVAAGVWGWRKLTGRSGARGAPELEKGLDWQYLRGKIDRETYMRRKSSDRR
jgi:hypothetical protein